MWNFVLLVITLFSLNFQGRGTRENKVISKLNNNTPAIPPVIKENELSPFRKSLPIYEMREHILKLISENQVEYAAYSSF